MTALEMPSSKPPSTFDPTTPSRCPDSGQSLRVSLVGTPYLDPGVYLVGTHRPLRVVAFYSFGSRNSDSVTPTNKHQSATAGAKKPRGVSLAPRTNPRKKSLINDLVDGLVC